MLRRDRPIGVFDSGLGGLTVVKEIKKINPQADVVYLGDTARIPYGTRSKQVVEEFSVQDAKFLEKQGVGAIVIACNTASALATQAVSQAVKVPVYEVITAGSQAAAAATHSLRVGVIGTRATIGSHAYAIGIKDLNPKIIIHELACPLLVPLIEEGETKGEIINLVLSKYLKQVKQWRVDTLILGCTHYPLIERLIRSQLGNNVRLINSGEEVAKRLPKLTGKGKDKYFVTDMTPRFIKTARLFLGYDIGDKTERVKLT
ncbi:MAG: glutamate racemase [bacterium]|nr:glutamate racemase [bacterium]